MKTKLAIILLIMALAVPVIAAPPSIPTLPSTGSYSTMVAGDAGNHTDVAADGTLTMTGTARVNKIVSLGIDGLATGGSAPTVAKLGNFYGYSFTKGDDGYIRPFEIPYDWDSTTNIIVKIHWYVNEAYAAHSGEVRWNILYTPRTEVGEAVDAGSQTLDFGDVNIPATAKHLIESTAIIPVAQLAVDDVIGMTLTTASLVAGTDPTAEPVCVGIEIEYVSNKLGE